MTKVSIIIPFHNVENYISKCLSTIIYQTLEDIEIICVNDASSDLSKDIVLSYAKNDKRILLLNTQELSGQSYARNIALEIASGEYIGFVDADDWIELDMFEKMYNLAKEGDTDITMCQAELYDDKEQVFFTNDYYSLKCLKKFQNEVFNVNDAKTELLDINVVLWNKIYRNEFLTQNKMKFQSGYIYEDMPFFFETFLKAKRVNVLWESLYYYRQNRNFSTMRNSDKKVYDRIPMASLTYNILKQADFFEEKKIDIVSWLIDDIFHRYTLLEDKYYEEYYNRMKEFFQSFELTEQEKLKLDTSYCYEEFCNILARSYFGFWNFLIEKYKGSNKLIKAIKHENNESIADINAYWNKYSQEKEKEKEEIIKWWETHCEEEKKIEAEKKLSEQFIFLESKKSYEMGKLYDEFTEKLTKQEYELKKWNADSLRQQKEQLSAEFKWKMEEQKQHYEESLKKQKYYYENNFFLVKILLKLYKKSDQLQNKIKKIFIKN